MTKYPGAPIKSACAKFYPIGDFFYKHDFMHPYLRCLSKHEGNMCSGKFTKGAWETTRDLGT